MHFAALSQVGEAMSEPGRYWSNNVTGSLNLIEAAVAANCLNFVFPSTCATYGEHDNVVLDEDTPQHPLNAYGASKRAIEDILRDFEASHRLNHVIFRYFNVAGADPDSEVGEFHRPETHLVPLMLDAIDGKRDALTVNGTDYDTPDGTCIRDYVHVLDLARAHVLALEALADGESRVYNLGSGSGYSVREVIEAARVVTGHAIPTIESPRRPGDLPILVADSDKIGRELGWETEYNHLETIIQTAWNWHRRHPKGYDS